ncbi:MAG: VWA domain-containing protein [Deltaproteobacteria bacterium]|nr:VWA domain-containing protein [Deltaproteobacteria bacterium]
MRRALLSMGMLGLVAGCQPHELDPVRPAAAVIVNVPPTKPQLAPEVLLVVDRSGSMENAASGTQTNSCGTAASCKWDDLLADMVQGTSAGPGFLDKLQTLSAQNGSSQDPVQVGLVTFGDGDSSSADSACKPGIIQVPVAGNTVDAVKTALQAISPGGATPTASTLQVAAGAFNNDGFTRERYVVLVTDGLPNCNANIPLTVATCGGDLCTEGCFGTGGVPSDSRDCLDQDNSVAAVQSLASAGVKTFVIGFGSDTNTGAATGVLNAMANAGGEAQSAPATTAYYQASSQADLQTALNKIIDAIDACTVPLPTSPMQLDAVEVDVTFCSGQSQILTPAQWQLSDSTTLKIKDPQICSQLRNAAPGCDASVKVDFAKL